LISEMKGLTAPALPMALDLTRLTRCHTVQENAQPAHGPHGEIGRFFCERKIVGEAHAHVGGELLCSDDAVVEPEEAAVT
jgi:hypothetical protein